jgi:hypothetical protein
LSHGERNTAQECSAVRVIQIEPFHFNTGTSASKYHLPWDTNSIVDRIQPSFETTETLGHSL